MLKVNSLQAGYGSTIILRDISFELKEGQIMSVVGSNGAGKTTLMSTISGLITPMSGTINYLGNEIQGLPAYEVLKKGIALVPEGRRIFDRLTVEENLRVGAYCREDKDAIERDLERMFQIFPILKERRTQRAGTFSGGQQQMLAIARGLMAAPKLLILDEPSLGLSPSVVSDIFKVTRTLKENGLTIIIVEQHVQDVLAFSDYAMVIQNGRIYMDGSGQSVLNSDAVRVAYLGM